MIICFCKMFIEKGWVWKKSSNLDGDGGGFEGNIKNRRGRRKEKDMSSMWLSIGFG